MRPTDCGNRHPRSQPEAPSPSLPALEGMSDEVCILKRPAELRSSIRVALLGKGARRARRPCPGPVSGQNFFNNAVETDSWLLQSTMDTTSTAEGVGHSKVSAQCDTVGFERQCLIVGVKDDTASVSSLHFLVMTSFNTSGSVPIELVERGEQHPIVGLYVSRCGSAGAAQG